MRDDKVLLKAVYQTYRACLSILGWPVGKAIGGTDEITRNTWDLVVCKLCKYECTPYLVYTTWRDALVSSGWSYGETYNKARKKHPCLLSWHSADFKGEYRSIFIAISGVINVGR